MSDEIILIRKETTMQNILNKFDNIQIKSSIPKEDVEVIQNYIDECIKFYENNLKLNNYIENFTKEYPLNKDVIYYGFKYAEQSDEYKHYNSELTEHCLTLIKDYFEEKYSLDLKGVPQKLKSIAEDKNTKHYNDKYSLYLLDINKICNTITDSLEGFTLTELQLRQLKSRILNKNTDYNGKPTWILKGKILTLKNSVYISTYHSRHDWKQDFKDLFIALTKTFTGIEDFSIYTNLYNVLNSHPFTKHNSGSLVDKYEIDDTYIDYMQIYQNGNLKVSFKSKSDAERFVREFLYNDL